MDISKIKKLNAHIEKMEEAERSLTGMVDQFGNNDVRAILAMIVKMDQEDLVRMFQGHYVAELDFHRRMIQNAGIDLSI